MAETGQKYALEVSADGVTYTAIGKVTSFQLDQERELINTNNFDSPDWEKNLKGMRSWSLDQEMLYVYDDAGQVLIRAAFADATTIYYWKLTSAADTVGVLEYTGQGICTSLSFAGETNGVTTYSISVSGDGALTTAAITT